MKKGFTMIELIFVIVILGILASVAIPRLASTRTDAEVSALAGNIRTLISDLSSYYAVKGSFTDAKWGDVTNVPIHFSRNRPVSNAKVTEGIEDDGTVYLSAGGTDCIVIRVKDSNGARPAYIEIAKTRDNVGKGICPEVLDAAPIKAFLDAKVPGVTPIEKGGAGVITFGSSISIYQEATTTTPPTTTP